MKLSLTLTTRLNHNIGLTAAKNSRKSSYVIEYFVEIMLVIVFNWNDFWDEAS